MSGLAASHSSSVREPSHRADGVGAPRSPTALRRGRRVASSDPPPGPSGLSYAGHERPKRGAATRYAHRPPEVAGPYEGAPDEILQLTPTPSRRAPAIRAFVTGLGGFVGHHLGAQLASAGHVVTGIRHATDVDIRDAESVRAALEASRPGVIFHLVAAPRSADPAVQHSVDVVGTTVLLELAAKLRPKPTVLLVSSSAVYGRTLPGRTVSERQVPRPQSHYGASKLAQEQAARRTAAAHGLRLVRARPFNLLGPGLPEGLVLGAVASAIPRLERRRAPGVIQLGNLSAIRDFIDVRDAVRAFAVLALQGRSGSVYNVCTGRAVPVQEAVNGILRLARTPIRLEYEPARPRADNIPEQVGDSRRLQRLTGWSPQITLEQSLADMLEYERRKSSA